MKRDGNKQVATKKRNIIIYDEEADSIIVLNKKGKQILKEKAYNITFDFKRNVMCITKNTGEITVLDFNGEQQMSYSYEGNMIVQIKQ